MASEPDLNEPENSPVPEKHVLIIDGAYFEIGIKELNQKHNTNFNLLKRKNVKKIFQLMEMLVGHPYSLIFFVTAEDQDTYYKKEKFYEHLQIMDVKIDMRDFKFKNVTCKCKYESKQKIQAEVDVAITVKLMLLSQKKGVESITLFAGDRDFIDPIEFARGKKSLTVISFQDNVSSKIMKCGVPVVIFNKFFPQLFLSQPAQITQVKAKGSQQQVSQQPVGALYKVKQSQQQIAIQQLLQKEIPPTVTWIEGKYFKEEKFRREIFDLLKQVPSVGDFEIEHAMFVTESQNVETLINFILSN